MAERKPPGFTIPLGFYDGPEVESIPRRIRAAAVGVWALAGTFSANKLQDGYVGPAMLKQLGCTDAIRAALMATRGPDGDADPLWIPARDGGIQFTKWSKYQRSRAEVKAYRDAEAERKRIARKSSKPATNSGNVNLSGRTLDGQPPDDRTPKAETETETENTAQFERASSRNVDAQHGQESGRSDPVDPSASRLVATLIPSNTPAAIKTALRLAASQLLVGDGMPNEVVAEALRRWQAKPDAGPGLLPHIASSVQREATAPAAPKSKLRDWAELEAEVRAQETASATPTRKAIGQ